MRSNGGYTDPTKRHDFVLLFDVKDGNPNGDPDAGNLPRIDPETMYGLVTDVCIKRKIRDFAAENGQDIYVKHRGILAKEQKRAYTEHDPPMEPQDSPNAEARAWMCRTFYDIRLFGAVMTTGKAPAREGKKDVKWNCGQVRGPVQITFARSCDPIVPLDISITRVALTNVGDTGREDADDETEAASGQMGRKAMLPYGLYRAHGFFSPRFARDTKVQETDLSLLWRALEWMWEDDHSAARGEMACRGLYVFTHENPLGNAHAHELFERVHARLKDGVEAPRAFADYVVTVNDKDLPKGVTLATLVG
jgi:CRISPR-associated protein Csd2